ncbi:MAG: hypothetical protein QM719_01415 [Thermomonas sp.]
MELRRIRAGLVFVALCCPIRTTPAQAAAPSPAASTPPCRATEVSRNLDFWIGDWDVYADGQLAGRDQVERLLDGCAVVERWRDTAGDEGMSLFAYDARRDLWTQTWVTARTDFPGGLKSKVLRAHTPTSTTFQGELETRAGVVFYDRTILTAQADGHVRQQIQTSRDGVEWKTGFDAIYVAHGSQPQ